MQDYPDADTFFAKMWPTALTYDDVSLATNYSMILPREAVLEVKLSKHLTLPIPVISADMDTVTESHMAIAMALSGGMGLIHYNMTDDQQLEEVRRVKAYSVEETSQTFFKTALDSNKRLRCGAAICTHRKPDGSLDSERILWQVGRLVEAGVDAVAVSTAHGHTAGVGDVVKLVRGHFAELTIIAGNVTSGAGVAFLAEAGANVIKIGQGPGSICTTRVVAGVGIPQLTALYYTAKEAKKQGVCILADGGITKSGDIVKALTLADAVICGGLLAACEESPGEIVEVNGTRYKQYRGMGSEEAMKAGSAARYGHTTKDVSRKAAAEGVAALKPLKGTVFDILAQLMGGLQSGMGYLGAKNLAEVKAKARYVAITNAGFIESNVHDVVRPVSDK